MSTTIEPSLLASNTKSVHEGKRGIRRKDNARFAGNPHIVAATRYDYIVSAAHIRSTFPVPLPPYLPRTAAIPTASIPGREPLSANAGRFSLSLKGMRRELRKSGVRVQGLVNAIEHEMLDWLHTDAGPLLSPDVVMPSEDVRRPVSNTGSIFEVSRTPLELVWFIPEDAFARYVVHCCARYHEIVSFSKERNGSRFTHLLRPNVTRPDYRAPIGLQTPPATDIDHAYSSQPETDSDDLGLQLSDIGESDVKPTSPKLSLLSIRESPTSSPPPSIDEDAWSFIDDTDAEGHDGGAEDDTVPNITTLSLESSGVGAVPMLEPRRQISLRNRVWDNTRSASSPSRSPARRPRRVRRDPPWALSTKPKSFYDYLFL